MALKIEIDMAQLEMALERSDGESVDRHFGHIQNHVCRTYGLVDALECPAYLRQMAKDKQVYSPEIWDLWMRAAWGDPNAQEEGEDEGWAEEISPETEQARLEAMWAEEEEEDHENDALGITRRESSRMDEEYSVLRVRMARKGYDEDVDYSSTYGFRCPSCRTACLNGFHFCPGCGKALLKQCVHCSIDLLLTDQACSNCITLNPHPVCIPSDSRPTPLTFKELTSLSILDNHEFDEAFAYLY